MRAIIEAIELMLSPMESAGTLRGQKQRWLVCCFVAALWFAVAVSALLVATVSRARGQEVLQFGATWCGPCQRVKPIVDRLHANGLPIRHVDIDSENEWANAHGFRGGVDRVPLFIVRDASGNELKRVEGAIDEDEIVGLVKIAQSSNKPLSSAVASPLTVYKSANFTVTAEPPHDARVIADWAEFYRLSHWRNWFGCDPPNKEPTAIEVVFKAGGNGGVTIPLAVDNQWHGASGQWAGDVNAGPTVITHEVMHIVLHENLKYAPPRWLDEGIAANTEGPEHGDWERWREMAVSQMAAGKVAPLRWLNEQRDYVQQTYPQGTMLVSMLLEEKGGRLLLVRFAKEIRDKGLEEATKSCYRKTPEEIDACYRVWLQRRDRCCARRLIDGVLHIFCDGVWCPQQQQPLVVVQPQPQPQQVLPAPSASVCDPKRFDEIEARLKALEGGKQDKGDYATRGDIPTIPTIPSPPDLSGYATKKDIGETNDLLGKVANAIGPAIDAKLAQLPIPKAAAVATHVLGVPTALAAPIALIGGPAGVALSLVAIAGYRRLAKRQPAYVTVEHAAAGGRRVDGFHYGDQPVAGRIVPRDANGNPI